MRSSVLFVSKVFQTMIIHKTVQGWNCGKRQNFRKLFFYCRCDVKRGCLCIVSYGPGITFSIVCLLVSCSLLLSIESPSNTYGILFTGFQRACGRYHFLKASFKRHSRDAPRGFGRKATRIEKYCFKVSVKLTIARGIVLAKKIFRFKSAG